MLPNRIAVYFVAAAALAAALVPVIADLDTESVVGMVGGVGALASVVGVWLHNWGKYEERTVLEEITRDKIGHQSGEGHVE